MIEKPTILAIETATNACAVGLLYEGTHYHAVQTGQNIHSQVLLSMIDGLFKQHQLSVKDLTAVAVDQGPGSFTGLRIGIGVAQGLAFAGQCPMIGVSSLDILANQVDYKKQEESPYIVAGIDARMSEIYWCVYQIVNGKAKALGRYQVNKPDEIDLSRSASWLAVGNAWSVYADKMPEKLLSCLEVQEGFDTPEAHSLLHLAEQNWQQGSVVNAMAFAPEYVRNDVAKKHTFDFYQFC